MDACASIHVYGCACLCTCLCARTYGKSEKARLFRNHECQASQETSEFVTDQEAHPELSATGRGTARGAENL